MTSKNDSSVLGRLLRILGLLEDGVLVFLLAVMIVFAVTQILLRNLFETGVVWADPLLRIMVLWVGLVGAMVASRTNNHISINVLLRRLPKRWQSIVQALVDLFTATVCAVLGVEGVYLVLHEYQAATIAFAIVPSWIAAIIIPIALTLMALRYLGFATRDVREFVTGTART